MPTEKKERIRKTVYLALGILTFAAALGWHYLLAPWGFYRATGEQEAALRLKAVRQAESYLGSCEADGSHKQIIDLYNSHEPLAVGYTVAYTDSWCAAFVSATAIAQGLTDIIPTECSCQRQIDLWKSMGRWEESDSHIPQPGDLIYYDWDQSTHGESTGWADHVGMVAGCKWPFIKVIEGNKDDAVSYRVIPVNEVTVRGFGLPDYQSKASAP